MPESSPLSGLGSLESAMEALAHERRKFQEVQQKLNETNTVVHAKDRLLSLTVDGRGELVKLKFDGARYRRLPPAELAQVIIDAVADARRQAVAKLSDIAGNEPLPGVSMAEMAEGKIEVDSLIESFLGAALDGLPSRLSGSMRAQPRDES